MFRPTDARVGLLTQAMPPEPPRNDIHLLQYRDPLLARQVSTVLCREHRIPLMARLRALIVGCVGTPAPILARCDECLR